MGTSFFPRKIRSTKGCFAQRTRRLITFSLFFVSWLLLRVGISIFLDQTLESFFFFFCLSIFPFIKVLFLLLPSFLLFFTSFVLLYLKGRLLRITTSAGATPLCNLFLVCTSNELSGQWLIFLNHYTNQFWILRLNSILVLNDSCSLLLIIRVVHGPIPLPEVFIFLFNFLQLLE